MCRIRNKYNNRFSEVDGIKFHSKKEAKRYTELVLLQKAKIISNLFLQPKFDFPMGFRYVADFMYNDENGNVIVEDVKGFKTDVYKLKKKCFEYFYSTLKLIEK